MTRRPTSLRWFYMILGVVALLFAGVIYAWSILKAPLGEEFGWTGSQLALNFTLTMCFFCLGGFAGGLISKRIGSRLSLILAAALADWASSSPPASRPGASPCSTSATA